MAKGPERNRQPNRLDLIDPNEPIENGIYIILRDLADERVTREELEEIADRFPPALYFVEHFDSLNPRYCQAVLARVTSLQNFREGNFVTAVLENEKVAKRMGPINERNERERRRAQLFADLEHPTGEDALERIICNIINCIADEIIDLEELKPYIEVFPPLHYMLKSPSNLKYWSSNTKLGSGSIEAVRTSHYFIQIMDDSDVVAGFVRLEGGGQEHLVKLWKDAVTEIKRITQLTEVKNLRL